MTNYFNSSAIGSSVLGQAIARAEPLQVITDRITDVQPSPAMELGRMFEDLVEATYTDIELFWEKYFESDLAKIPEYKGEHKDVRQILEILDDLGNSTEFENAYIRKDDGSLHGSFKSRHRCLDQIKAHDYRRPLTTEQWSTLELMLKGFKAMPFTINEQTLTLHEWMTDYVDVQFQVEHFWSVGNAKCRAKFDMIWTWEDEFSWNRHRQTYGICFDLKATGSEAFGFSAMWRNKYIWQAVHYADGWENYCEENNINYVNYPEYDDEWRLLGSGSVIWYIVQESGEPCITHMKALAPSEREMLKPAYYEALEIIQSWIDAGKPIIGHTKQEFINRWGK